MLGVQPRFSLDEAINLTMAWYAAQAGGADAAALCEADLRAWIDAA
jgi:CDP-glucose 4,6-dehydratase